MMINTSFHCRTDSKMPFHQAKIETDANGLKYVVVTLGDFSDIKMFLTVGQAKQFANTVLDTVRMYEEDHTCSHCEKIFPDQTLDCHDGYLYCADCMEEIILHRTIALGRRMFAK